jgi:4-hydroxybenzoate polyprenyltransferase
MSSQPSFRHYAKILHHFAATRSLEVLVLQASPMLGCYLGGFTFTWSDAVRAGSLFLGSFALTAHVFIINDWAGHASDMRDPRRAALVFARKGISRGQVARTAIALLILATVAFAFIGKPALLLGSAIAMLGIFYSCLPGVGKSTPVAASINHLLGGILHFLLGYTVFDELDGRGLAMGLFFGLVFAAGHLNQEVRDAEADGLNGIRTSAVVFGSVRTFLASVCLFTMAYALMVGLAAFHLMPQFLVWSALAWLLQVAWSVQTVRRGLGFETAKWIQRRYRLLFAIIGLAMLVR